MSSNDQSVPENTRQSVPIPIASRNGRGRSMSVSSASSGSMSSGSELPTPPSGSGSYRISIPSPSTSPILSYFLQSPTTKTPSTGTFPFKRTFGPAPVLEEEPEKEMPAAAHARRASATFSNRFSQNPPAATTIPDAHVERGTNLLRRLSLSSNAFVKPQLDTSARAPPSPPPNSAASPTIPSAPFHNKPRRSATISSDGAKPRRAPSPMGERILKGHFDGFN